jgi:signal transduction histidine kinase
MAARHRHGLARDVSVAVVVTVITLVGTRAAEGVEPVPIVSYALLVLAGVSLVARRHRPRTVLAITLVCAVALGAGGDAVGGPFALPFFVALFAAVSSGHLRAGVVAAGVFLVAFAAGALLGQGTTREALPFVPGWTIAVVVAGAFARSRADYFAEARRRAVEAERGREEEMRRRATEERLRIAREVHDVLSHSISMINVQAGVAVHLLDTQPEQARTALVAIKQASKDALRDLRATLGVLRDVDEVEGDDRGPARGLARLEELVTGAAAAGVDLDVVTRGEPVPLPAGVDLAAYRIVQQSVSNVVRHAGPTSGTVELRFAPEALTIVVDNAPGGVTTGNGHADRAAPPADPAATTDGAGRGIAGMRERAEALGGRLHAGPRDGGGFRVEAVLPVGGRP